jgi:hypothetical protein
VVFLGVLRIIAAVGTADKDFVRQWVRAERKTTTANPRYKKLNIAK